MSAKSSGATLSAPAAPSKSGAKKLLKEIKKHLEAAILPGDIPLDADELDDAAAFLLSAAERRTSRSPALRKVVFMQSDSDR